MTAQSNFVIDLLLQLNAIHLASNTPFQWASGWLAPIYCDNRRLLSNSEGTRKIANLIADLGKNTFQPFDAVVGVATGAIAMGVLVAQNLDLPFAYVRPKPKDHGMGKQIEGSIAPKSRVLVVEDLVSTGMSSLAAVRALREQADAEVVGMVALFSYAFPQAAKAFEASNVKLATLANYPMLISLLRERGELTPDQLQRLEQWRLAPETWSM